MNKAIITGATGLVGRAVSRLLCSRGIELLCLGRKDISTEQVLKKFGDRVLYIPLPMTHIEALPKEAQDRGWKLDDSTVFYNFAWSGIKSLTDGSFGEQLTNAINAAEAVKVAKRMKCCKFINSGSMEESFIELHLNRLLEHSYQSSQTYYGLAKLAARDMSKIISYLEKIDYVHTRMSVPLDPALSQGGYISSVLKKISKNQIYDPPTSAQLYDIILLNDVSEAYYSIGLYGINKADYFIGTGRPLPLQVIFEEFHALCRDGHSEEVHEKNSSISKLFDIKPLEQETGFVASGGLEQILSTLERP